MCLPIVKLSEAAPNVELKEKLNDLNCALGRVFNEYILLASTCNTTMKIFAKLKLMQPGKFGYICDKLTLLPQSNHDLVRLNETLLQPEYAATFRSQLLDAKSHEMSKILTIPAENLATTAENYFCCVNTAQHPDTEALLFVGLSMAELKILLNPPQKNEFSNCIYQPSLVIFQELFSLGKKAHEVQPTFLQMLKMVFVDADLEGLSFTR